MTVPKTIIDKQAKLEAICEKYPQRIPPDVCADFFRNQLSISRKVG